MEEWDQWRADNRSLEMMRQIALDAMSFEENDDDGFYDYAEENDLTVNEDSPVSFTGSASDTASDNGDLSYMWDFGDGGTSTEPNPTHPYSAADYYLVVSTGPLCGQQPQRQAHRAGQA